MNKMNIIANVLLYYLNSTITKLPALSTISSSTPPHSFLKAFLDGLFPPPCSNWEMLCIFTKFVLQDLRQKSVIIETIISLIK